MVLQMGLQMLEKKTLNFYCLHGEIMLIFRLSNYILSLDEPDIKLKISWKSMNYSSYIETSYPAVAS